MTLNQKIKILRTEKEWTQKDLSSKLDVQREQISIYERGQALPTTEVLIKMAKVFEVSTDYLLFEKNEKHAVQAEIRDAELLKQLEAIDKGSERDRKLVKEFAEALLFKTKLQKMIIENKIPA